jgi:hypothetical protein
MNQSFRSRLLRLSNGEPNKETPINLLHEEFEKKSLEKGKRVSHPLTWEKNKNKILKNSVSFTLIRKFKNYYN